MHIYSSFENEGAIVKEVEQCHFRGKETISNFTVASGKMRLQRIVAISPSYFTALFRRSVKVAYITYTRNSVEHKSIQGYKTFITLEQR